MAFPYPTYLRQLLFLIIVHHLLRVADTAVSDSGFLIEVSHPVEILLASCLRYGTLDHITFEDVLGVRHSLHCCLPSSWPSEAFRSWSNPFLCPIGVPLGESSLGVVHALGVHSPSCEFVPLVHGLGARCGPSFRFFHGEYICGFSVRVG